MADNQTTIFTDGAAKGNPGPGGWGAIIVDDGKVTELGGKEAHTSNNRMELVAVIGALKFARQHSHRIVIYSDSSYVINGISKWIHSWQKNHWQTSTKQKVLNIDLWQELENLAYRQQLSIDWRHIGGHIGIAANERVDRIASAFADNKKVELYSGPLKKYYVDISNLEPETFKRLEKASGRSKSKKVAAYSYVSELNGIVRVHKTWADCQARVKGRPARFKKALSEVQEQDIIREFTR